MTAAIGNTILSSTVRRFLPWAAAILLSVAGGFAVIKAMQFFLEQDNKSALAAEVQRRAVELMAATMNGNVMGSVASLGLVNRPIKQVARGEIPLDVPHVTDVLRSIGEAYQATGVYVINRSGIIRSNWVIGRGLAGVNVNFRPYFQIAMKGRQNVYAAIGTTSGERGLYFAAPLYDAESASAPVIGATVARLGVERIDAVLSAWPGPALLLSPQQITFASNRAEWIERMAVDATPQQLQAIRALRQFGRRFETETPKTLPFDIRGETVSFDKHRYVIDRAQVQWNDPQGDWTLVLLSDLDALMPASRRVVIGTTSGTLVMLVSVLFMVWRRRMRHANEERESAQAELRVHLGRLTSDSEIKSYIAAVSSDLQRAGSLTEFAGKFMYHVAQRVSADYGAFYVFDAESKILSPIGGYGALSQDLQPVALAQGLVGQCAKDMTPIAVSDPAETDIRVVWGAGTANPKSIVLLPVVQASRLLAVIVLAALQKIDADGRALLDTLMPTVAMSLEILKRNLGTQQQAEILRQQQTRLQETEAWYRSIIESAPDGMLVIDEHGVIILTNPQIEAMFGYDAGALVGKTLEVLVPAEVRPRHPALREGFVRSGTMRAIRELRGARRDGTEFPVEIGLSILPALGAQGLCVCATVRDITERKRAEDRLRQVLEDSPAAVLMAEENGALVFSNHRLGEMLGVSEDQMKSRRTAEFWAEPEKRDVFLGQLKQDGRVDDYEARMRRDDGSLIWVLLNTRWIELNGQRLLLSWLYDITERKHAEQVIMEERTRLQAIIDTSPICLAFTVKGRFRFVNPAFEETFGVGTGDEAVQIYAHPEDRDRLIEGMERDGIVKNQEFQMLDSCKRVREMLATFMPISYGGEDGVLGWLLDVTERKKIEDIERFNRLALGREERIIELKREVNTLAELARRETPYASVLIAEEMPAEVATFQNEGRQAGDDFDAAKEAFVQLVRREQLQDLFVGFCESVGIAAAIIDLEGVILAAARWQRVCTDFHRVNERSCANCIESDTGLALKLEDGADFTMYKCKNGMTDCAAPIIIDGHHVANVFIGQFHLQKPDPVFFRSQAAEFGFDADRYLAAVEAAPVMDEAKLPHILGYLARFARLIGSFAVQQRRAELADKVSVARSEELRRERLAAVSLAEDAESARGKLADYQTGLEALVEERTRELEKTAAEVRESEKRLRGILETSPVCIAFSTKGIIHFANSLFVDIFGAKVGEPSPQLYVNPADRDDLIDRLKRDGIVRNYELKMYDREHRERDMLVTYLPINYEGEDGILGWLMDITERKRAEDELIERLEELERFGRLTVDREEKMIQLKQEINDLLTGIGKSAKYKIVE